MRKFLSLVLALIVAMLPLYALTETAATPAPAAEAAPAEATAAPEAAAEAAPAAEATPAPDPNKVVATVDGENILYSDVENYFSALASQYTNMGLDVNDASIRPILMDQALNYAIQIMFMEHKAEALGLDKMTDEEIANLEKKAADDYNSYMTTFTDSLKQSGVAEEEAKTQAEAYLASYGFTLDTIKEQYKKNEILTRLQKSVTDPVQVTDEQVKATFDEAVAGQKTSYDETPGAFCDAKLGGTNVYYTPAGVRTVKHILIKPEKIDEINQLKTKIADAATTEADKTDAQAKLDELIKEVQPKVDEVVAKIKAGEDFQGLIDTYGEDPGMKSGDTATTGYYVAAGASFEKTFLDAALALKSVGDVSDPVLGSFGYHIIRYEADVPSGTVDFETVKETLSAEALKTAQQDAFTKALDEWKAAAKIENFGL